MTAARDDRGWELALAIAAGGALGSLARYGLSLLLPHRLGDFPWSTFLTNVSGCLAIGVLVVLLTEVVRSPHRLARPFLAVGLLGGFTTFSTYAVEAQLLLTGDAPWLGLVYLLGTLIAALVAVRAGILGARALARAR